MVEIKTFAGSRAVSPVIGVVLMISVTVLLAAIIGTFVLGLAPLAEPAPNAQLGIESSGEADAVTLVHNGGDTIDLSATTLLVDGSSEAGNGSIVGELRAGESVTIDVGVEADTDATVTLRHDPSGGLLASETVAIHTE